MPADWLCTGLRKACRYRYSQGNLVEESVQVGRDVGTSTTVATLRASVVSIWVSVLDGAVMVDVRVLQTNCNEILLGGSV
jgi:hypothetical protein